MSTASAAFDRPEFIVEIATGDYAVAERPLSLWDRLYGNGAVRKIALLVLLGALWQAYAVHLNNALLFPTLTSTLAAFWQGIVDGVIPQRAGYTLLLLVQGYALGIGLAMLLTTFATISRIGADLLETLTAMFNPLPSIALLPLALVWFGLGNTSILFVLTLAVLWSVSLNTYTGFRSVSQTLRMVGHNYGLSGARYFALILIPAAFPSILVGLKIGWAFAWRTLIAAELVFGVSSGGGGLGWFIYENKNDLNVANVFAGLLAVIVIGLFVENVIFSNLESHTVRKWGMQV